MIKNSNMSVAAKPIRVRSLSHGSWYWINKNILFDYGNRLKPTGIAVYNVLAAFTNSKTQTCFPTQALIARICGISTRTVIRKIQVLEYLGLVRIERARKVLTYCLLEHQIDDTYYRTGDKSDRESVTESHTNKNKRTRINNDKHSITDLKTFNPKTRAELLAKDLALALNDPHGFSFYLSKAKVLPEGLLRAVVGEIRHIPNRNIHESRGALFNHLLQKHVQNTKHNPRD